MNDKVILQIVFPHRFDVPHLASCLQWGARGDGQVEEDGTPGQTTGEPEVGKNCCWRVTARFRQKRASDKLRRRRFQFLQGPANS